MIRAVLDILRKARDHGGRAVVLVPETVYEDALHALACLYPVNAGRTAKMPDGNLVSVVTPSLPIDDIDSIKEGFNLYLAGWGRATPIDERGMSKWVIKARKVYTEISGLLEF